jgi:hypothetical protein
MDTLTEMLVMMARYDGVRTGEGHYRWTTVRAREHNYGISVRVQINHKRIDGETKTVGVEHLLHTGLDKASGILSESLYTGHEMLDTWAYEGKNVLTMTDIETERADARTGKERKN